jgi:hypothetical protein
VNSIQNTNKLIFDEISISRLVVYFIISKNIFYFWDDKVNIFIFSSKQKIRCFSCFFLSPIPFLFRAGILSL